MKRAFYFGKKGAVIVPVLIVLMFFAVIAISVCSSDRSAFADIMTEIKGTDDLFTHGNVLEYDLAKVHETNDKTYDFDIDFGMGSGDTTVAGAGGKNYYVSGNFHSEQQINISKPSTSWQVTDSAKPSAGQYWRADFAIGPDLTMAIRDELISVKVRYFYEFAVPISDDNEQEAFYGSFGFYSVHEGDGTTEDPRSQTLVNSAVADLTGSNSPGSQIIGTEFNLTINEEQKSDDYYLSFMMSGFTQSGSQFGLGFKRLAIKISCTVAQFNLESFGQVISNNGMRHIDAPDTQVRDGDLILITNNITVGASTTPIRISAADDDGLTAGRFYRKLYFNNTRGKIFNYIFEGTRFVRTYTDENGDPLVVSDYNNNIVNLNTEYSGAVAAFYVQNTTHQTGKITAYIDNATNTYDYSCDLNFDIDNTSAPAPSFSVDSPFVEKYITGTAYYTDPNSYIKTSIKEADQTIRTVITGVNILRSSSNRPGFSAETTQRIGSANQCVYYKVSRLNRKPTEPYGTSLGFGLADATGVALTSTDDGDTIGEMNISLVQDEHGDLVNDSLTNYDLSTLTFNTEGWYSIELITVDYVGNRSICKTKYYIFIDVNDYEFTYESIEGTGESNGNNTIPTGAVTVTFATLLDDGVSTTSYTSSASFKRGARVIVRVQLAPGAEGTYILTGFAVSGKEELRITSGGSITYIKRSSSLPYSFEVDSLFTKPDANRKFVLKFKRTADIRIIKRDGYYDGTGKELQAQVQVNGEPIMGTLTTVYRKKDSGDDYSTTLPVNAGEYEYKCELANNAVYYAVTQGIFTIKQAEPVIRQVTILPLDYGRGMEDIDFREDVAEQDFNNSVFSLNDDGNYYSNRSYDGIYGYYRIAEINKDSLAYTRPSANANLSITVEFVPIKWSLDINRNVIFEKKNGKFVQDNNYKVVPFQDVSLVIKRSEKVGITVLDEEDGAVTYEYDSTPKAVGYVLTSQLEFDAFGNGINLTPYGRLVYIYPDGSRSGNAPVNAGEYGVLINLPSGNYTGEWLYTLIIEKRRLDVECATASYYYQAEGTLRPVAKYEGTDTVVAGGLKYKYEYYYYDGISLATSVQTEQITDESLFSEVTKMPADAGEYAVKVILDEQNYCNSADAYSLLRINKVRYGVENLSLTFPTLAYNTLRDGNLSYKQPMSQIRLSKNTNTGAYYMFRYLDASGRVRSERREVTGMIIVTLRRYQEGAGNENETREQFLEKVAKDTPDVGLHTGYFYFVPTGDAIKNFEMMYRETNVQVGKASYNIEDVEVDDIIYGKSIRTINDITISYAAKILITGSGSLGEYLKIGQDSENWAADGYEYSLGLKDAVLYEAGTYRLEITVTPFDTSRFYSLTESVDLTVQQKELTVTVNGATNYYYGEKAEPAMKCVKDGVIPEEIGGLSGSYYYYDPAEPEEPVTVRPLPAGTYNTRFEINNRNYCGRVEYTTVVNKAKLVVYNRPMVYNVDKAVSYNRLMKDVTFFNGAMTSAVTKARVDGVFKMDYIDSAVFTDTDVTKAYFIKFVPADESNYEVYREDDQGNRFTINLTVAKADISETMSIRFLNTAPLVYGDLASSFNIADYATCDIGISGLQVDITVKGIPSTGYVGAGEYLVTASVNDANYSGEATDYLVVDKKQAEIVIKDELTAGGIPVKAFSNKNQSVSVAVRDSDGIEVAAAVTQVFYLNGTRLSGTPSEIGRYYVTLNLSSNNYSAPTVTTDFIIRVDINQVSATNLQQTYGSPRAIGVSAGLNMAYFTIGYRVNGEVVNTMPTDAGLYDVVLFFDAASNSGYEEEVTLPAQLNIKKCKADIIVGDYISTTYTGKPFKIRVTTNPKELEDSLVFGWRAQGAAEFTETEVLQANTGSGYHEVKITIEHNNYYGETRVNYRINPASLTMISAPVFYDIEYGSDIGILRQGMGELKDDGLIIFGNEITETSVSNGGYVLPADIADYSVGTHRVDVQYVSYDFVNFAPLTFKANLTVVPKVIPAEYFVFGTESGNQAKYNGNVHAVDVILTPEAGVKDLTGVNSDFQIKLYYYKDNKLSKPIDPGSYTVRAAISARNYSGEATWASRLTIETCIPEIIEQPTIKSDQVIRRGDRLYDEYFVGGIAVIPDTGEPISGGGSFTVVDTEPLTQANYNDIEMEFRPNDTSRFSAVTIMVKVFVVTSPSFTGVNSGDDWTDQTISVKDLRSNTYKGTVKVLAVPNTTVTYGMPLSAFTLKFEGTAGAVNYLKSIGTLSFADRTQIAHVGELVDVVFTPTGSIAKDFNIMYGKLAVEIAKAPLENMSYQLKCIGDTIDGVELIITDSEGKAFDAEGSLTLFSDEPGGTVITAGTQVGRAWHGRTVYFRYEMNDYVTLEGAVPLEVLTSVGSINVTRSSKPYDGNGITVADLGITVHDVSVAPAEEDIFIRVYKNGVEITDVAEMGIGDYTVTVVVSNNIYYGTRTVPFSIVKADAGMYLELSFDRVTYKSFNTAPAVRIKGGAQLSPSEYKLEYRPKYNSSDYAYRTTRPVNAGEYLVRVTIVDSEFISGSKVTDFTIERLSVSLVAQNRYVYECGAATVPSVSFKLTESGEAVNFSYSDVTINFYSDTYSLSAEMPQNAGEYRARVSLNDQNYSLDGNDYAEFAIQINRMSVTVANGDKPLATVIKIVDDGIGVTAYNLIYGQPLSALVLTGGKAIRNGEEVEGKFYVSNPSLKPASGTDIEIALRFVPDSSNYAIVEDVMIKINVDKADLTVYFESLQTSYNGTSRREALAYTVSPAGVGIDIKFSDRNGQSVKDPVAAGQYVIEVESRDSNYRISKMTAIDGGSLVFVIAKASVDTARVVTPTAGDITVGENLKDNSDLKGGRVYYHGFAETPNGEFKFGALIEDKQNNIVDYRESTLVFMQTGNYTVDYVFIPNDSDNYAFFTGKTQVHVGKAIVESITVSNNEFVYSEGFSYPTFTTNPANLNVKHNISFNVYDPYSPDYVFNAADIVDVGIYEFEMWIDDDNYASTRMPLVINITQKEIDLDFVDADGNLVVQYRTTYGNSLPVAFKLYPNGTKDANGNEKRGYLYKDEVVNGVHIAATYSPNYSANGNGLVYDDRSIPTEIGTYTASVTLNNKNYKASKSIIYRIDKGVIEDVFFNDDLLENQVYGSVSAPAVYTVPSGVQYYITYQGFGEKMPTDAGIYNITIYFNDPHYEKKQVSSKFKINKKQIEATGIQVSDKVYDGVAALKITGELSNVILGDEVYLNLAATTVGGATNAGYHGVEITEYYLTGLKSANYELVKPVYYGQVLIGTAKVTSTGSNSFLTSATGFNEGTTVEFKVVDTKEGKSTFFEKMTGRTSQVIGYSIQENGVDSIIDSAFKVYVEIPEEFRDCDFDIIALGGLGESNVIFTREGDYITFFATSSGQIRFKKTKFQYQFVVILASIIIFVVGVIFLFVMVPLQHSRKFHADAEKRAVERIKKGI